MSYGQNLGKFEELCITNASASTPRGFFNDPLYSGFEPLYLDLLKTSN